jgi:hypothetical protein
MSCVGICQLMSLSVDELIFQVYLNAVSVGWYMSDEELICQDDMNALRVGICQ